MNPLYTGQFQLAVGSCTDNIQHCVMNFPARAVVCWESAEVLGLVNVLALSYPVLKNPRGSLYEYTIFFFLNSASFNKSIYIVDVSFNNFDSRVFSPNTCELVMLWGS